METYKMTGVTGQNFDLAISLFNNSIAEQFDSTKNYYINDIVLYDGLLYSCITDTAGEWNSSAWVEQKVFDTSIIYQPDLTV